MAATKLQTKPTAAANEAPKLSGKAARQVSDILEQAGHREAIRKPELAYRIPSPGVRYYF